MIKSSVLSTVWAWGAGTLRSSMADQSPELLRGWESKAQASRSCLRPRCSKLYSDILSRSPKSERHSWNIHRNFYGLKKKKKPWKFEAWVIFNLKVNFPKLQSERNSGLHKAFRVKLGGLNQILISEAGSQFEALPPTREDKVTGPQGKFISDCR